MHPRFVETLTLVDLGVYLHEPFCGVNRCPTKVEEVTAAQDETRQNI
jgi:hypothetical protein